MKAKVLFIIARGPIHIQLKTQNINWDWVPPFLFIPLIYYLVVLSTTNSQEQLQGSIALLQRRPSFEGYNFLPIEA